MSTYVRTEVNYTEEVDDPIDSDGEQEALRPRRQTARPPAGNRCRCLPLTGEVLGFENLVFSIFEFVHTLLENNKFKTTVKKALPELIYYIILYMQITEDQVGGGASGQRPGSHSHLLTTPSVAQIKAWTANPQQFVEDEDDDTFSYSVRISAQDLLLVRREPIPLR